MSANFIPPHLTVFAGSCFSYGIGYGFGDGSGSGYGLGLGSDYGWVWQYGLLNIDNA